MFITLVSIINRLTVFFDKNFLTFGVQVLKLISKNMSFPNGSAFAIDRGAQKQFQIDPQELYEYPADDTITPLKTCPLVSEIKVVDAPLSGGDNFTFETSLGMGQYLSNDVKLVFTIPLTVKLTTASTVKITEENFLEEVFNNNSDIVFSQYSILQAIQNLTVKMNDQDLDIINNVSEAFNMAAPYYSSSDVDEYFHASQPDRYQSFDDYTATNAKALTYFDESGSKVQTSISETNDSNIFGSKIQNRYIPRTPVWKWVGEHPDGAMVGARVKCTFFTYIPLSFFSAPGSATTIPGVSRLSISARFKSNTPYYLFNIKKTAGAYRYTDIAIDNVAFLSSTAKMILKIYTPPQYMRDAMIDKSTGLMKPYSISYPRIVTNMLDSKEAVVAGGTKEFNRSDIQTNSVPSSLYIALVKKKNTGSFTTAASTPINFGLITNLTIRVDSAVTNFNDIYSLSALADSNGYDELDPIGRLMKGFPIKIDVSKDLSLPGDTVVGATGNFRVDVSGSFINQGAEAANYQLVVVVVNPASLEFDGASFKRTSGAMISSSVLTETNFLKDNYSHLTRSVRVVGGGVFGDIWKGVKKGAVNAWNNREQIAKLLGDVSSVAKMVRGGKLPASNTFGAGDTPTLGAGQVKRSVFK